MKGMGSRLKNARVAQGLSQAELAARVGISKGTLSMTERDVTSITCKKLFRICEALNLSPSFAFTGISDHRIEVADGEMNLQETLPRVYRSGNLAKLLASIDSFGGDQVQFPTDLANFMTVHRQKIRRFRKLECKDDLKIN